MISFSQQIIFRSFLISKIPEPVPGVQTSVTGFPVLKKLESFVTPTWSNPQPLPLPPTPPSNNFVENKWAFYAAIGFARLSSRASNQKSIRENKISVVSFFFSSSNSFFFEIKRRELKRTKRVICWTIASLKIQHGGVGARSNDVGIHGPLYGNRVEDERPADIGLMPGTPGLFRIKYDL